MGKMQEHVLEGKEVYVGLEDSKRRWKLCVRSGGLVVHELSMPAEYENLRSYLCHRYPGCTVAVIYEAGFGGFWLHDALEADGIRCEVTPPTKVTQEKVCRVKNDKVDARRLAKILESDDYKSCFVPDLELRQDRQVSRTLVAIQKDLIRIQGRIRQFFNWHHLEHLIGQQQWRATHVRLLRDIQLPEPLRMSLDIYLQLLETLLGYRRVLRKRLQQLSRKQRYRQTYDYYKSAPGIGWLTSIRLVLEFGEDMSRFGTGRKFSSFLGLTGSEHSTGEQVRMGHITGQGNRVVRGWLVESAWTAYKRDPVLLKKFQRVFNNTKSKKKAIVAVARKLAVRLWHLAVFKEAYTFGLLEEQPQLT
jgi:transposase